MNESVCFAKNYMNESATENGAAGYRTTTKALLDMNFKVSSLRDRSEGYIVREFMKAFHESPKYAVKWLFFLRDILEGLGREEHFVFASNILLLRNRKLQRRLYHIFLYMDDMMMHLCY